MAGFGSLIAFRVWIPVCANCICVVAGEGSTRIFIIGPDDGRQGLTDIARQLSKDVVMRRLAPFDITVSHVDDIIQGIIIIDYLVY